MKSSRRIMAAVGAAAALATVATTAGQVATADAQTTRKAHADTLPGGFKHLVVIYEENHSFDNLYGHWGPVNGQRVIGLDRAPRSAERQVAQDGTPYRCLLQNDVNLTAPSPLASTCQDPEHAVADSHFRNRHFLIDRYIKPEDKTCPAPGVSAPNGVLKDSPGALPGGCTRDLVHRFYQNIYQIDGGKQDRYVTGSNAVGLTMGTYATKRLPIYRYLHSKGAPHYVIADRFFQAAFGGSFLNHQWLVAARTPLDTSADAATLNSLVDDNGMPTSYPLYKATGTVADRSLTVACPDGMSHAEQACGNFAVNTMQPSSPPAEADGTKIPLVDDATYPNIGDRLSAGHLSWNWYSGGWDEAAAGTPGPLFQTHHQPLNYFASYAEGQPGRRHLKDETDFFRAARTGHLPMVSFVKPYGAENEHPGYASEPTGSDHLVRLLKAISRGRQADSTLVVVTYDEFGGQWDHVPPPGPGSPTRGVYDAWGPGTRIPALVLSTSLRRSGVDHTVYDTTSILATIERSFGLAPLSSRDAMVHDLRRAVAVGGR
ncbi:MAG TPA: alkaline phosphatase family protein [Nocardioidaceae bacterium]|nr:alkaline phosphatase family protein [Nocardioidaceae bacterium]